MNLIEYEEKLRNSEITYKNILNLPKNLTFGIEIEYEKLKLIQAGRLLDKLKDNNPNLKGWINKCEVDICETNKYNEKMNGEISTPILTDKKENWESLKEVLTMLNNNGAIITDVCGGHVNIGIHILENNIDYYKNMILLWLLYSDYIRKFSFGEFKSLRKFGKLYFQSFDKNLVLCELEKEIKSIYELDSSFFDKHHELYLHRLYGDRIYRDDRIEFRLPNGSLSPSIWQNYVNFFAHFILSCKKELDREKIIYDIKNNNSNIIDLINLVFDKESDKEDFLIQTLKTNKVYCKSLPRHILYDDKM